MVNPARRTTVQNAPKRPGSDSPVAGLNVTIKLNVLGFIDGGTTEILSTRSTVTDANGRWSMEFDANIDIDPGGTYYTVHEGKFAQWTMIVPPTGGTVNLRDILVVDPANPSPLVAGVPLPGSGVPAGDVWTTDGEGGGDYAPPAGGGGDVQTVAGVSPDGTGNVPLTAGDVGAATSGALTSEAATARAAESANATAIATEATSRTTADGLRQLLSEKGQPSGYAALDGGGTVPDAQLPAGLARDAEVTAAVAAEASARTAAITAAIAALVNSAPGLMDTLAEIDAALNNDPNFAATMTAALNGKQGVSAQLTALAGLVSAANKLPYFTGAGAAALADFTSFARTLLDDPDAVTARATLGLGDVATHNASEFQPIDADLTTIAALDAAQSGVIASDGTGWFRKTYAQLKTALGLVKADVGLGNVDNTSDVNKPVSTAQAAADAAVLSSAQSYTDGKVVGLLDFRGSYDASVNTFPVAGGSGTAGAVVKGDVWIASVGGTLGGVAVTSSDLIVALVDTPGQTAGNWDLVPHDGAYVTLTGNQTIAGTKTFSTSPVVPTPAGADNSTKVASTAYVDAADALAILKSIGTTKGDQIGFTGSGAPVRHAIGADGTVQTADSTQADGWKWAAVTPAVPGLFGDASDGTVSISTTVSLARDMFYNVLTITGTGTLNTNGFRVFAKSVTVQASGKIAANGLSAAGSNGGSGVSSGTLGQGRNGSSNGGFAAGTAGASSTGDSYGGAGGAGGAGTGGAGGAASTTSPPGATSSQIRSPLSAPGIGYVISGATGTIVRLNGGGGGASGGGDGATGHGGGGGGSGGVMAIVAGAVSNSGAITATGGNGANGDNGNCGGGGGGGGGDVLIITGTFSGTTPTAAGGSGGTGLNAGGAGSAGTVLVITP